MRYARTPEAPEHIAFSDSRWIPMAWAESILVSTARGRKQ